MNPMHPILALTDMLWIPIIAIVFGCSIAIVAIYTNYRKRKDMFELYHRERMAAIDKGIELPPLPGEFFTDDGSAPRPYRAHSNLLKGLILLFAGVAVFVAIRAVGEPDAAWFGLIPSAIGLAHLVYYGLVGRREATLAEAAIAAKLAETKPPGAV